jgi:hypothetical protein
LSCLSPANSSGFLDTADEDKLKDQTATENENKFTPQRSPTWAPGSPSNDEAIFYYAGLPSRPRLVARTGTIPWYPPTGPEAYPRRRELRTVGKHKLKDVWEDNLAPKIHAALDLMKIKWTSTDVVRIKYVDEDFVPVVLWIGVIPGSLDGKAGKEGKSQGFNVASRCREILVEHGITDVEVEIRQSIVTRSAGPKLLAPVYSPEATVESRDPLTTTLGLSICAQATPWTEGTGGFFITEGENTDRVLLVTARHIIFTSNENNHFECKDNSQPRYDVALFGDSAFQKYLRLIKIELWGNEIEAEQHEHRIGLVEGKDDKEAMMERQQAQRELEKAREATELLNVLYEDVSSRWATPESRLLGHVVLSPPINHSTGGESYYEDWAVTEVDSSKIDASNFKGNAIDLGTEISIPKLILMLCPDFEKARSFKYPLDRLLRLKDTIPDDEMRHPIALDKKGYPCLMVLKRGNTTGLTVGRANDVCSYTQNYSDDVYSTKVSKEWAILQFDSESGPFSDKGDSGSVIVDGLGRFGGLLTGGAGTATSLDITYATPISFLLRRMQENGLHEPNLNPVLVA